MDTLWLYYYFNSLTFWKCPVSKHQAVPLRTMMEEKMNMFDVKLVRLFLESHAPQLNHSLKVVCCYRCMYANSCSQCDYVPSLALLLIKPKVIFLCETFVLVSGSCVLM